MNVRAVVRATHSVSPPTIDFGDVDLDAELPEAVAEFAYGSATDGLVAVELADPDQPWLEHTVQRLVGNAADIRLRVARERLPLGRALARLVVRTTSADVPTSIVPVKVRGVSPNRLEAFPPRVYLSAGPQRIHFIDSQRRRPALQSAVVEEPVVGLIQVEVVEANVIEVRRGAINSG